MIFVEHLALRRCQTNLNQPQIWRGRFTLRCAKASPLVQSSGAVVLDGGPRIAVMFLVEIIVDGGMNRDELLETSHAPKSKHPLPGSGWLANHESGPLSSSDGQV